MVRKILFAIAFYLTLSLTVYSQDIQWEKSYGGKHAEYLYDALPTPDYGFLLAGSSLSKITGNKTEDNSGNLDYFVWKMDEKGNLDWQKSFGGSGSDHLTSIQLTNDAGFILGGFSDSNKSDTKTNDCKGGDDYWIVKLNAKGAVQWQRTIGGSGQDRLYKIIQTKDNGYLLGGSSSSSYDARETEQIASSKSEECRGGDDFWIVKLDASGKIEWQRTIGGSSSDQFSSLLELKNGNFLIGGTSNSKISGDKLAQHYGGNDFWIISLSNIGGVLWQKSYGGSGDDQLQCMEATKDGNVLIAGNSNSSTDGNKDATNKEGSDLWLIKIGIDGEALWQKTYDVGEIDILASVIENADGTIIIGSYSRSSANLRSPEKDLLNDFVIIKIQPEGGELWKNNYGSAGQDILRKVIETRDGSYLLAGTSNGKKSRDKSSGNGNNDFWVIKIGDKMKKQEKKESIEAFPNPTAQFTNVIIGYEYLGGTATVYDIAGRMLDTFKITDRTIPINLGGRPEGIYIVEIRTEVSKNAIKIIKTLTKN